MRLHAKTDSAKLKVEIQALLRQIALKRQDGLCFFLGKAIGGRRHAYCTSNLTKDGHIVMQYDHLLSRAKNVSFANPDLGVAICQGLHGWKSVSDGNKKLYDIAAKKYVGARIRKLWKRCEDDGGTYPMGAWEWSKEIIWLKTVLKELA